jgi:hypothetical protein
MGFAGNVEPCFISPTIVAVNDSFSGSAQPAARGTPARGNWLAQHSAGVMADLEALARSRASSSHNLSYPIRNGQVGAPAVYCRVQLLVFFPRPYLRLIWAGANSFRWRIGIPWRGSGNSASSITSGATQKIIIFF